MDRKIILLDHIRNFNDNVHPQTKSFMSDKAFMATLIILLIVIVIIVIICFYMYYKNDPIEDVIEIYVDQDFIVLDPATVIQ